MDKKMTYEQAAHRLEEIVAKIERGDLDVDSLAANLKEAKALVDFCKVKLTKVEADVKKILEL